MMSNLIKDEEIPYFCWDRSMTAGEIKEQLRTFEGFEFHQLMAWILREAAFADVWQFVTPQEVSKNLSRMEPFLGRRKAFWKYIINKWHELGKL